MPQLVTMEYARSIGAVMENLRTWTMAGVRYVVMYAPVLKDQEEISKQNFNAQLNEFLDEKLGPGRRGRRIVSLDPMLAEGYMPAGAAPSAEAILMEGELLQELFSDLAELNPLYAEVVRLGYEGLDRKEIVDLLPVKKSQAYEVYRRCREEAEKWLREE